MLGQVSELIPLRQAHDFAVLEKFRAEGEEGRKEMMKEYIRLTGVVMPKGFRGRKDLMIELGLENEVGGNGTKPDGVSVLGSTCHQQKDSEKSSESIITGGGEESATRQEPRSHETSEQRIKHDSNPTTDIRQFFIHRPEISTAQKQIISQVDNLTSLRDILRGKTVREFPTFLVEVPGLDEIDRNRWHLENETNTLIAG